MKESDNSEKGIDWHQTKSVSITIIILLLTNIVTTVWWAATLTRDVDTLKGRPNLEERVILLEASSLEKSKWIAKIDSTLDQTTRALESLAREQIVTQTILKEMIRKQ